MTSYTPNGIRSVRGAAALLAVCALVFAACSGDTTTRDDEGEIIEGGEINVFEVQEGDCLLLPSETNEVSSFEGVACDEPHDGEIYELFDITGFDDYPGDAEISAQADEGCFNAFEPFIGLEYAQSVYFVQTFVPNQQTWDGQDDREVICIVVPAPGEPQLTMSLEGVAQ